MSSLTLTLLAKDYDSESLCDVARDVSENLDHEDIQKNVDGLSKGTYSVVVIYHEGNV